MGLVNAVVEPDKLLEETDKWVDEIVNNSPTALAALKASFNADSDALWGVQSMAGVALGVYYGTEEAKEVGAAFREKRTPDVAKYR